MKGKNAPRAEVARSRDVLADFSRNQLMWLGAIAMAFNEVEFSLHDVVIASIEFPGSHPIEIVSRIQSMDELIRIALISAKHSVLPSHIINLIEVTLVNQGLSELKKYRDRILHARIFDKTSGEFIGMFKKGAPICYLTLEECDLKNLFEKLQLVQKELDAIAIIMDLVRNSRHWSVDAGLRTKQLERALQDEIALIQSYQKHRQSLRPLPPLAKEHRRSSQGHKQKGQKPHPL